MLTDFSEPLAVASRSRAEACIANTRFERPTLVVDTEAVADRFGALTRGLGDAHIHYAVKANPEPAIIARLVSHGFGFDAASRAVVELCPDQGASPDNISFGNTVKKPADIANAHAPGIPLSQPTPRKSLKGSQPTPPARRSRSA